MPADRHFQVATYAVAVTTIVVLRGDQTGQELLDQALRVIHPDVIDVALELQTFDLSLERRRETPTWAVPTPCSVSESADA